MPVHSRVKVGVVGCGKISGLYLTNCTAFPNLQVAALADVDAERARAQAEAHGIPQSCSLDDMLADPGIELIINLTPPLAHTEVTLAALEAGKHVYSEKPLAATVEDGRLILETAEERELQLGCAPDTFLGGMLQTCRNSIDRGLIGEPVGAAAFMLNHGHESWHPAPDFYYQPGGGPLFDMGPYYLTALVSLVGPIQSVAGLARTTFTERAIGSEPRRGELMAVSTPTHIACLLDFAGGSTGTMTMSFDVWAHQLPPIEIYGTEGTIAVPDPNQFGGTVRVWRHDDPVWREVSPTHEYRLEARGLGVAEMAHAIRTGRAPRASGRLAFHVLEVMEGVLSSSEHGCQVAIVSRCPRPEPLPSRGTGETWQTSFVSDLEGAER